MSSVIWHVTMSLDGFITGPDDSMAWLFDLAGGAAAGEPAVHRPDFDAIHTGTGAILAGRRWYDVATWRYDGVAGIYGGQWTGPVFVLTHQPPAEGDADPSVSFVSGDLEDAVAVGLAAADDKNLEIFGARTAEQCLAAGLLDEIIVHIAPVLLGDGVRLYSVTGGRPVNLERRALSGAGLTTDLRFTVVRS